MKEENYDPFWEAYEKVKKQIEPILKSMTINSGNHWNRRYFFLANNGEVFTSPNSTKFENWWYKNVKYRKEHQKLKDLHLLREHIIEQLHRKQKSDNFNEFIKVNSITP